MSDIEGGIYIIRRDVIGIDNVIATGVGIEIPVLGLPLQESNPNVQRWEVRRADDDSCFIIKPGFLPGPPGGFGVEDIRPDETVRFKQPSRWVIKVLDQERQVYSIQAVGGPIGAIYAIDLEKRENEEELVLKPFPVIMDPPPLPGWIFTAVNDN